MHLRIYYTNLIKIKASLLIVKKNLFKSTNQKLNQRYLNTNRKNHQTNQRSLNIKL